MRPGRSGRPAPPPTPAPAPTPSAPPTGTTWAVARRRPSRSRPGSTDPLAALPTGSPARAGVLTETGDLVVWRERESVLLAGLAGYGWRQAVETAHEILVTERGVSADPLPRSRSAAGAGERADADSGGHAS